MGRFIGCAGCWDYSWEVKSELRHSPELDFSSAECWILALLSADSGSEADSEL